MKNVMLFLVGILLIPMLNRCSKSDDDQLKFDQEKNAQIFLEAVEIVTQGRIKVSEGNYARIFKLNIYNEDYKPLGIYVLNGEEFTDDGKMNDPIAGDGIYTSTILKTRDVQKSTGKEFSFVSENFKYSNEKKSSVTVGCKVRHVRTGRSALGLSCDNWFGCFELYDCEIEVEIEW